MSKVSNDDGRSTSQGDASGAAQAAGVQVITPELRAWIVAQAQAGCRPEDVLAAMTASALLFTGCSPGGSGRRSVIRAA